MNENQTRRAALLIATISAFITPFMGSAINIALVQIQVRFQMNAVLLSWVPTSFLLAAAVFLVPFGRLADLYGRKKIFFLGMIIFTAATLAAGLSTSAAMLIAARAVQGLGGSMIFANGVAILTSVYPKELRGRVLGLNVAAVYVGLSVGPFLGGLLTEHFTWRSVFLATVPLGLLVIVLVPWRLKGEWADARGEKFDLFGSLLYGLAIVALIVGISLLPSAAGFWLIGSGVLGLAAFIVWESRTPTPVFELKLFTSNRAFAFSNLAALINYMATFAVTFLMSLYLQYLHHLSPEQAGIVLVAQPLLMAAASPFAGRLSDRIEPAKVASLGMALSTVGLALLIFLGPDTSLAYVTASLVVLGLGFGLFSSPNTNAILSSVEKRFYGLASGAVGTMRMLGQMFSMAIATLLFTVMIGRVQITPALYPAFLKSVNLAFTIFTVLCGLGVFASLVRGNIRKEN